MRIKTLSERLFAVNGNHTEICETSYRIKFGLIGECLLEVCYQKNVQNNTLAEKSLGKPIKQQFFFRKIQSFSSTQFLQDQNNHFDVDVDAAKYALILAITSSFISNL